MKIRITKDYDAMHRPIYEVSVLRLFDYRYIRTFDSCDKAVRYILEAYGNHRVKIEHQTKSGMPLYLCPPPPPKKTYNLFWVVVTEDMFLHLHNHMIFEQCHPEPFSTIEGAREYISASKETCGGTHIILQRVE